MVTSSHSTGCCLVRAIAGGFACAAIASQAGALTVFDFDDFPGSGIPTSDYGCDGKSFCTEDDTDFARRSGLDSLSKRVGGVTATFTRPGEGDSIGILPEDGGVGDDNSLSPGNIQSFGGDLNPFVGDFSKDLLFVEISFRRALDVPGMIGDAEFAFLEAWSDPGATGALLGRTTQPVPDFDPVLLSLSAAESARIRSIRFGLGLTGCESGCEDSSIADSQGVADDIAVQPVPEPSAALLFLIGTWVTRSALRRRAARTA
jgi:hypothetical protein